MEPPPTPEGPWAYLPRDIIREIAALIPSGVYSLREVCRAYRDALTRPMVRWEQLLAADNDERMILWLAGRLEKRGGELRLPEVIAGVASKAFTPEAFRASELVDGAVKGYLSGDGWDANRLAQALKLLAVQGDVQGERILYDACHVELVANSSPCLDPDPYSGCNLCYALEAAAEHGDPRADREDPHSVIVSRLAAGVVQNAVPGLVSQGRTVHRGLLALARRGWGWVLRDLWTGPRWPLIGRKRGRGLEDLMFAAIEKDQVETLRCLAGMYREEYSRPLPPDVAEKAKKCGAERCHEYLRAMYWGEEARGGAFLI